MTSFQREKVSPWTRIYKREKNGLYGACKKKILHNSHRQTDNVCEKEKEWNTQEDWVIQSYQYAELKKNKANTVRDLQIDLERNTIDKKK